MKRVEQIITAVRLWTENEQWSTTDSTGIADSIFIEALNDAQRMLQGAILRALPEFTGFDASYTCNLLVNDREIYLPGHSSYTTASPFSASTRTPGLCFMGNAVRLVEFSTDGQNDLYYVLYPQPLNIASVSLTWPPSHYSLQGQSIYLGPTPDSVTGKLRVTYIKALRTLDIRRGTATTLNSSGGYYTTIVCSGADDTALGDTDYICIVDQFGNTILENMPVSSYNSSTDTITLVSSSVPTTTITASPLYVVTGRYATTHSNLFDEAERYLREYCKWRIFRKDSSTDADSAGAELGSIEADIISNCRELFNRDPKAVPVMDDRWFA